jgi:hypothetical protein
MNGAKAALAALLMAGVAATSPAMAGSEQNAQQQQQTTTQADPPADAGFCDAYGTGYQRVPGTDTCVKIGGHVQMTVESHGN